MRLPVASVAQVRRHARTLIRHHRRGLARVVGLHGLAAVAGLALPWLVGTLVQDIQQHAPASTVDKIGLALVGAVAVQAVLTRFAVLAATALGEAMMAQLREEFVDHALALPLSTVESAGTGDLLTRTSRDVDSLAESVRYALPEILIGLVSIALGLGALVLVSPRLAAVALLGVPTLLAGARWYLRRAPAAYLRQGDAFSELTDGLTETVDGARTVEALRIQRRRVARTDIDVRRSFLTERYTLRLRTAFFPAMDVSYLLPVVAMLVVGGIGYAHGWVSLLQVTAATLYVQQLIDPLDRIMSWLDRLQVGQAALARLLGIANSSSDVDQDTDAPAGRALVATDLRFSYVEGREVLRGVSLTLRPGETLAIVGPSGAGKSTLGRLLAGVHTPTSGHVTVGGVSLADLPLAQLRGEVALVTQEHHVFLGTLRENLVLARPDAAADQVEAALRAVDAWDWAGHLLETEVGSGALALTPAQAQQIALARLVIADPHTLVLDEATSLIDPRAARHLERSLAAVLAGRTVVAIAHRLFSAHDADRVAVVEDGRVIELGSHDELIAADGSYAALWRSWHGDDAGPGDGVAVRDNAGPGDGAAVGGTAGSGDTGRRAAGDQVTIEA